MTSIKLTVTQSKNNFNTYGYVNGKTLSMINSNNLVVVMIRGDKNVIINLKKDDALEDNYIALSMHTRKLCSYCLETNNNFEYVDSIQQFPFPLEKIVFTITPFNSSEIKDVDCVGLSEGLKKVLSNTSINIGQVLGVNVYGIKMTIDKFVFYDDDTIGERQNGFICGATEYDFNKGVGVKLVNKKSSTNNQIFNTNFDFKELDIGGMDKELTTILRRVFISRVLPSDIIAKLNITHVKGLIMYGPPGTGKTLIARQLSKCLKAKSIKIINGPELLSKWLGETEKQVRELFAEAEADQKSGEEGLHVIIFDEFDSVAIKRGSVDGISGDVNNKIVTQLLSKIDG